MIPSTFILFFRAFIACHCCICWCHFWHAPESQVLFLIFIFLLHLRRFFSVCLSLALVFLSLYLYHVFFCICLSFLFRFDSRSIPGLPVLFILFPRVSTTVSLMMSVGWHHYFLRGCCFWQFLTSYLFLYWLFELLLFLRYGYILYICLFFPHSSFCTILWYQFSVWWLE